jgi:hypothetical protein
MIEDQGRRRAMSENAVIFVSQLSLSRKGGEVQATDLQNCGRGNGGVEPRFAGWLLAVGLEARDWFSSRRQRAHGRETRPCAR